MKALWPGFSLLFILLLFPSICSASPQSIFVFPFEDRTGEKEYRYLGEGIQDTLTIDLWYVEGINTKTIGEAVWELRSFAESLAAYDREEALSAGRRLGVDQIWRGNYTLDSSGNFLIRMWGYETGDGKLIFKKELTAEGGTLYGKLSRSVVEILGSAGISLREGTERRILSGKSGNLQAILLNAEGYSRQQDLTFLNKEQRKTLYSEWIELLEGSVEADGSYAEAWTNLGWAYYTAEKYDDADRAFAEALTLKPFLIDANIGAAYVSAALGNPDKEVAFLEKALSYNESIVRHRSMYVRAIISNGEANLPRLIQLAKEGTEGERISAIKKLGHLGKPEAIAALAPMLEDESQGISWEAAGALSRIGGEKSVELLLEHMHKSDKDKYEMSRLIESADKSAAVDIYIDILGDRESEYREAAALRLGAIGSQRAVEPLATAVYDYSNLSFRALEALQEIGGERAVDVMIEALESDRLDVTALAALYLGDMEDKRAIEPLRELYLKSERKQVRVQTLLSMATLGDRKTINYIKKIAKGEIEKYSKYKDLVIKHVTDRKSVFEDTEMSYLFEKKKDKEDEHGWD